MTTLPWPNWLDDVWAKSPEPPGSVKGETLAQHTWNVLHTTAGLIRLRPWLADWLDTPGLWNRLFWAAWLHDLGKAAQGFQAALRGKGRWRNRHEVLSLAFLEWLGDALSEDDAIWVAAAIASHHRDANEIGLLYGDPSDLADEPLAPLLAEITDESLRGLSRWLHQCCEPWIEELGLRGSGIQKPALLDEDVAMALVRDRGHERVRDRLRTYRRWMRALDRSKARSLILGTLALRGHLLSADHMASAHVVTAPSPLPLTSSDLLVGWGLGEGNLYHHQRQAMLVDGDAVLIAPTGSGKTEAAILWAVAQRKRALPVPRLFYALPYQASMNAMYDRLNAGCFPGLVGLEHSRSVLALYRRFLEEDPNPTNAEKAARVARNLAALNHLPVRVLSPYQVLKAPYRLKGYEALLSDFFGATFVLDEIHAYEPGRLAMILATVKYLREQFDARFFVMSATLPALLKVRLLESLGSCTELRASTGLFAQFTRHMLHVLDGDLLSERWLDRISADARAGHSVLVCCNTVARAQQAQAQLLQRVGHDVEVVLLHGRFNGGDRLAKEKVVREATGRKAAKPRPIVLVATQVVEVSLDIDLDVIYTDPAPLDALVQRFGRINRAGTKGLAPVYVFTEPNDGQGIYDAELVGSTLRVLGQNADRPIEEGSVSEWLDEAYDGEIARNWSSSYETCYEEFESTCLRGLRAFNSDQRLEDEFYRAFDAVEVLPACRQAQYEQLLVGAKPLEAAQQLVPLRWKRLAGLLASKKAARAGTNSPYVVDAPYSYELGLQL